MPHSTIASAVRHWHLFAVLVVLLVSLFYPNAAAMASSGYCLGEGCVDSDPLGLKQRFAKDHGDSGGSRGTVDPTDAWPFGEIIFWDAMGDDGAPIELPGCNCYFSPDCSGGSSCDYQVLSLEDNCAYMDNKPNGVPGAGCDVVWIGGFQLGICDGFCTSSREGSSFGHEQAAMLQQGVRLWGDAFLMPALSGGGYPDEQMVSDAMSLPYNQLEHAALIGRYAASTLSMAAGLEYQEYYCHYEAGDPNLSDYFVDLSDDTCLAAAAQLSLDALLAEMNQPDSGKDILNDLRLLCPDQRRIFPNVCSDSYEKLNCGLARIQDTAVYLTTPRQADQAVTWIAEP